MARRSYDQFCPAARALDVLGERWTLLIVRDLLSGPRRYTDLMDGLPGIGPNVLAQRLRELQEHGLVTRETLPPPAASVVYVLTPLGRELEPVLGALARWGLNFLGTLREGGELRLTWLMRAIEESFDAGRAAGVSEVYGFSIDGEAFSIAIDDGEIHVVPGARDDAAFTLECDAATFLAVGSGREDAAAAMADGRARLTGDPVAARRALELLSPQLARVERATPPAGAKSP